MMDNTPAYAPRGFQTPSQFPLSPPINPFSPGQPFVPGTLTPPPSSGSLPFVPGTLTPFPFPQQSGGLVPPIQPGTLTQANLTGILASHPRPQGAPPVALLGVYQLLKSNPGLLRLFIQQRPQSLQHALQLAQTGSFTSRPDEERVIPGSCYFQWTLAFTFTDVYLIWPAANFFGFVVGYCAPFSTPCAVPDFQVLFSVC
ncbi:hypothetical protein [Paenibacillus methanolicus]|nr:hypothetical protein [Paenibacillus methanolicus]